MLQSIAENSKNNNPSSKKTTEIGSKTTQNILTKTTSEPLDKRNLVEKTVANVNKTVSGTAVKNQQNSDVNTRKNVSPFLLTFEIFNRNVHNCMVNSSARQMSFRYLFVKKLPQKLNLLISKSFS
jgi:hypothetical protein